MPSQHNGIIVTMKGERTIFLALAPLIGGLITLMNAVNSLFSARVGSMASVIMIHITGLLAVSLVVLLSKEGKTREAVGNRRVPLYLYAGGIVGVGTVFACNAAYAALGASLAVALALLGQMVGSIAIDSFGFLGRKKYPLKLRSLPGIALAFAGILAMAGSWSAQLPFLLLAFLGGLLPLLTFTLNSQLALAKGIFTSARTNYLTGLATTLAVVAIVRPDLSGSVQALASTPLYLVTGGGILGVVMLGGINLVFPKIPAFWATLLMFAGQALTGLVIDAVAVGSFAARTLIGTVLVLAGLAANALLGREKADPATA